MRLWQNAMDNKRPRNSRRTPVTHGRRVQGNGTRHLSEDHVRLLKDSALSSDAINAMDNAGRIWRYETITEGVRLAAWGFSDSVCARTPGLLVHCFDSNGDVWGVQYRADNPRSGYDGKPIKYETPAKQAADIDIPPLAAESLRDRKKPIIVTEGARKADAAVSAGYCAVALLGVNIWRGPGWNSFGLSGRNVYVIYDSDAITKREVQDQERKLAMYLDSLGANVKVCRLVSDDGVKVGLDDFLFMGGDLEGLLEEAVSIDELARYEDTSDTGNARRMVDLFKDEIRYCDVFSGKAGSGWLIWNGKFWERDRKLKIQEVCKQVVDIMFGEARHHPDQDERKRRIKWCLTSESAPRISAMEKLAKSDPLVAVDPLDLDADPYLFNLGNGTWDLEHEKLLPFDPRHLITKAAPVEYVAGATNADWECLLDYFVRPSDDSGQLESLLQRFAFGALTGKAEKAFVELYDDGMGDTGKTTFVQSLLLTLGDYGDVVRIEAFLHKPGGGGIRADIAACYGKRLIVSSEVPPNARFDIGTMKKLTDGNKAQYQFERKYENPWSGPVTFHIIIDGNFAPKANVEDEPLWNRWKVIPFKCRLPRGVKMDKMWLEHVDCAEFRSAVLMWALAGKRGWFRSQIGDAPEVEKAVAKVRAEMNPVDAEYWETLKWQKGWATVPVRERLFFVASDFYTHYQAWALGKGFGQKTVTKQTFDNALKGKGAVNGVKRVSGKLVRVWWGVSA